MTSAKFPVQMSRRAVFTVLSCSVVVYHASMKKLLALLMLFVAASAYADWGQFDFEFDSDKPWKEIEAKLPPYPKAADLVPLAVSAASNNKFFVDGSSISVGEDGVVRYTLVVDASGGARNVTFEGIRCSSKEVKVYAFGQADGAWAKSRFAKWRPIRYQDLNNQSLVLYTNFFCPFGAPVRSAEAAVRALKAAAGLSF